MWLVPVYVFFFSSFIFCHHKSDILLLLLMLPLLLLLDIFLLTMRIWRNCLDSRYYSALYIRHYTKECRFLISAMACADVHPINSFLWPFCWKGLKKENVSKSVWAKIVRSCSAMGFPATARFWARSLCNAHIIRTFYTQGDSCSRSDSRTSHI